jgi:phage terminase small subunit
MEEMNLDKLDLTEKQKKFCREYIFDWNATRAAIAAGYSEKTAAVIGNENLIKPNIQAYIKQIQSNLEEVAGVSRLMVMQEYMKIAFTTIAHLHNTWIELKEFESLTADQKACIESIETKVIKKTLGETELGEKTEYVKIKLFSKEKALERICKMLGYDAEIQTEQPNTPNITIEIPKTLKILPANESDVC